jgi:hypothetical protein
LAGYTKAELIDQPHSLIRHPDMPQIIFKFLWTNLKEGKRVKAFVKNLAKDGGFYWVFANVHVANNPDGSFRNYISTRNAMSLTARTVIEPLYHSLIEAEKTGGMEASLPILETFLANNPSSLSAFNETMQKIQES